MRGGWARRMSCDGSGGGGSGGCHVMDLGWWVRGHVMDLGSWVRWMSCDGFGLVGQGTCDGFGVVGQENVMRWTGGGGRRR